MIEGIDESTPDPVGGKIDRDVTTNQPTGLLIENTLDVINPLVALDDAEQLATVELSLTTLLRHGVTSVCACENAKWSTFCRLADESRLPLRVFYSAYYNDSRSAL